MKLCFLVCLLTNFYSNTYIKGETFATWSEMELLLCLLKIVINFKKRTKFLKFSKRTAFSNFHSAVTECCFILLLSFPFSLIKGFSKPTSNYFKNTNPYPMYPNEGLYQKHNLSTEESLTIPS